MPRSSPRLPAAARRPRARSCSSSSSGPATRSLTTPCRSLFSANPRKSSSPAAPTACRSSATSRSGHSPSLRGNHAPSRPDPGATCSLQRREPCKRCPGCGLFWGIRPHPAPNLRSWRAQCSLMPGRPAASPENVLLHDTICPHRAAPVDLSPARMQNILRRMKGESPEIYGITKKRLVKNGRLLS